MSNADIIRAAIQAFDGGDHDEFLALCADDITMHWPGKSPLAGVYRGREAFRRLVDMEIGILSEGGWTGDYIDIVETGDRCVIVEDGHGWRSGGRTLDTRILVLCEMRDGKIAAMWEHPYDLYAWDEFWS